MSIQEVSRYAIISNIIQTSFGKSSEKKSMTHFLKMSMPVENRIQFNVTLSVRYAHQNMMMTLTEKYIEESLEIIKEHMKVIAKEYSEKINEKEKLLEPKKEPYLKEPPKKITLKLLPASISHTIELVSASLYSPTKQAFFRLQAVAEIT